MPVDASDIVAAAASVLTGAVGWVTGRRGREAQTRTVEATADATQAQAWAAILAGQRQLTDDLRTAVVDHVRAAEALLADTDRCHLVEWSGEDGRARHLLEQFRRRPGDATQRILL